MRRLRAPALLLLAACGGEEGAPPLPPPRIDACLASAACERPLVVAYGASAFFAPPNTLLGARRHRDLGADLVHVDVNVSRDGKAVVIRDQNLGKWTTCLGSVTDQLAADIVRCGVYDPLPESCLYTPPTEPRPSVPLLAEALAWAKGRVNLVIEIQSDPTGVSFREVHAAGMVEEVVFLVDIAKYGVVRQVAENEKLGDVYVLYKARSASEARQILAQPDPKLAGFQVDKEWADAALLDELHAAGKKVLVNTFSVVDPQAEADELAGKDRCQALFNKGYDLVRTHRPDLCSVRRLLRGAG